MGATDGRKRKDYDKATLFQLPWSKTEWAPLPVIAPAAAPATRKETPSGDAQTTPTASVPGPTRKERQRAREARQRARVNAANALTVGGIVTDPEVLYSIARRACFERPDHDTDDTKGGVQAGMDAAERASGGNMPPGRAFEDRLIREWNAVHKARSERERNRRMGDLDEPLPLAVRAARRVEDAVLAALHGGDVFNAPGTIARSTWFQVETVTPQPGRRAAIGAGVRLPPARKRKNVHATVMVTPRILPAIVAGTAWGRGWLVLDVEPDGTRHVLHQQGPRTFVRRTEKPE